VNPFISGKNIQEARYGAHPNTMKLNMARIRSFQEWLFILFTLVCVQSSLLVMLFVSAMIIYCLPY